ncbi:hypothetical protein [Pseudoxanthomonas kaohsiungensis]|uniref:Uncharacterized protein n=1 Tax=Pseudoxanthomonas kaohsiungensis TaxID=283923 RepID=A0ABW3LYD0_9GAMM|nr:hypothetical protein [Pseudoxanthomonas kaohsiungensis]
MSQPIDYVALATVLMDRLQGHRSYTELVRAAAPCLSEADQSVVIPVVERAHYQFLFLNDVGTSSDTQKATLETALLGMVREALGKAARARRPAPTPSPTPTATPAIP